jgi:hypothetical protein
MVSGGGMLRYLLVKPSRPDEFHLQPLTEPCVTLSRYTALNPL